MESTKHKHKRWRKQFNDDCLNRDGHKCVFCDETVHLDVHHITDRHEMPNGGYVMSNGITVCQGHHLACEREQLLNPYSREICYERIGSSYEQAYEDSLKLE